MAPQRIAVKNFLNLERQTRKASPHIGVAGRQPDPNAARESDHRRRSCPASASITRDSVASSGAPSIDRRTFAPNAIVIVPRSAEDERSAPGPLTATGTNAGRSSAAANCCRHRYNRLVLTPARRATSDALASGSFNAKTNRIFSARVQYRRFSFDVMISTAVITPVLCLRTEPVSAINRRRERRSPSEAYSIPIAAPFRRRHPVRALQADLRRRDS